MGKMYDVEENENFMITTDELSFFCNENCKKLFAQSMEFTLKFSEI
ncbi:hypothetical protein OFO03_04595 [Campylobacter sp. JMF_02 ED1]|nr:MULTISPECIES: hypothetical protein [unclassified Campylobacter]MDA3049402.1 hypothetical protein [Campylobacter sp. JMF_15 NE4]MDA3051170.1 hypothetical protein [Campylobacter sp. JMF_02 ED1]